MPKDMRNRPAVPAELDQDLERRSEAYVPAMEAGDHRGALAMLESLWQMLPAPPEQWDFWPDTLSRTGVETCRDGRLFDEADVWLERMRSVFSQGAQDPVIQLLEAQLAFERGDADAVAQLQAILQTYSATLFGGDDPKYLESARTGRRVEETSAKGVPDGPPEERQGWQDQVEELAGEGSDLLDVDWTEALKAWQKALALVPEPKTDHEEGGWLLASIGDAYHSGEEWAEAEQALQESMKAPGGTGNGYAWLRLGQAQFEQGNTEPAVQSLLSAYMLEGQEIFADEDPKYFAALTERNLIKD
ncbi:tetratricopeptide repeat protein [Propionibacteriaceae bacterium Y1700]|uniref:tetratricopeptide repeat protein n=1 Tax=Microlunatus sp. Y1700 TaxID=3418487 RepID=UPI003DA7308B